MHHLKAPGPARPFLDVVVVGEALIDVVSSPEGTVEYPGGSPANVAYGLGRLGVQTGLLTALGDDEHGAAIERHLHSAGVTLLPGSYSLDRTASATATLAPDGSASYDFDISWALEPVAPAYIPKVLHTGSIATFLAPAPTRSNPSCSSAATNAQSPMTPTSDPPCSAATPRQSPPSKTSCT